MPRDGTSVSSGRAGWRRDKVLTCSEMHEPDASAAVSFGAEIVRENEFPFPEENALPLPANLRNVFPSRTPSAGGRFPMP